ncbi:MAG: hypothetical protein BAJALOKI1v1_200018 [Promethearchaeota archaeon]|nr:MAG: hypothetical protein BAJALOKI1v1_200018 [Candidatus Lokiarchaeota archaeon]
MNKQNLILFSELFNWYELEEFSVIQIEHMIKRLDPSFDDQIKVDCSWSYHKKCEVHTSDDEPLYFFKYVREYYFSELLGLHLTHYYFDPELCASSYLTGIYIKKGTFKTSEVPYLFTRFVEGKDITNYDIDEYKFALGRQFYLHELLSLYDVFDRHFIVKNKEIIVRIDFGRSFENTHKKYLGINDYLEEKDIDLLDKEVRRGYEKEKEIIKLNLNGKKRELAQFIRKMRGLEMDSELIFFPIDRFVNRLIDHWSRIGFLEDTELELVKWI